MKNAITLNPTDFLFVFRFTLTRVCFSYFLPPSQPQSTTQPAAFTIINISIITNNSPPIPCSAIIRFRWTVHHRRHQQICLISPPVVNHQHRHRSHITHTSPTHRPHNFYQLPSKINRSYNFTTNHRIRPKSIHSIRRRQRLRCHRRLRTIWNMSAI